MENTKFRIWVRMLTGIGPRPRRNTQPMVTRADSHIGKLLDLLTELKLDSNTIVFFTSDNGGTSGDAHKAEFFKSNGLLRGQKNQLYEGGIRVPMVVRWPGKIAAGSTSAVPWSFCDFMPTAAELAGAKVPADIDGISMMPVLTAKYGLHRARLLYWEQYQFDRKANELTKRFDSASGAITANGKRFAPRRERHWNFII